MASYGANTAAPLNPGMPVALYVKLRTDPEHADRLDSHAAAFCTAHPNATLHKPESRPGSGSNSPIVTYIKIHGGSLRGALRGETTARRALTTLVAVTTELFMFNPVLVRPYDVPDASEGHPNQPKPSS